VTDECRSACSSGGSEPGNLPNAWARHLMSTVGPQAVYNVGGHGKRSDDLAVLVIEDGLAISKPLQNDRRGDCELHFYQIALNSGLFDPIKHFIPTYLGACHFLSFLEFFLIWCRVIRSRMERRKNNAAAFAFKSLIGFRVPRCNRYKGLCLLVP